MWGNRGVDAARAMKAAALLAVALVACLTSRLGAAQVVRGQVVDSISGAPVAGAALALRNEAGASVDSAEAASDGSFVLSSPAWGRFVVVVKRIGYRPLVSDPMPLRGADTVFADYQLTPLPTHLSPVVVDAQAAVQYAHVRYLERQGFFKRRAWAHGKFLDPEYIAWRAEHAWNADDLLRGRAMVMGVVGTSRGYRLRCGKAAFFIDDRLFPGRDLDQAIDPDDVLAIEIYDGSMLPSRFYGSCAIVVWTKARAEEAPQRFR